MTRASKTTPDSTTGDAEEIDLRGGTPKPHSSTTANYTVPLSIRTKLIEWCQETTDSQALVIIRAADYCSQQDVLQEAVEAVARTNGTASLFPQRSSSRAKADDPVTRIYPTFSEADRDVIAALKEQAQARSASQLVHAVLARFFADHNHTDLNTTPPPG